jgi:hypothetical protein
VDTNPSSTLIRAIVDQWPEWAPYVVAGDEGSRADRVLLSVPRPEHLSHRLEVACNGNAFEVAYECGQPGLRAAVTFGLVDRAVAMSCVCEFLREVRDGEMVVLVRRLPLLTRWRRSDGARYIAQFLGVSCPIRDSRWCVYQWPATR